MSLRRKKKTAPEKVPLSSVQLWKIVIGVLLGALLFLNFLAGKESLLPQFHYSQGQVSQHDIYAPFDFSFTKSDGSKMDVKRNELILQRGERVTDLQELALNALQLQQEMPKRWNYLFGAGLALMICAIAAAAFFGAFPRFLSMDIKTSLLISLLTLSIIFGGRAILLAGWSEFLIPLSSVAMLLAILVDPLLAVIVVYLSSFVLGVMTGLNFTLPFVLFSGSVVSVYCVRKMRHRRSLTRAGILTGMVQMLSIIAIGLLNFNSLPELIQVGLWGLANGIASMIITAGILPVLELLFGITTDITLLELSDLNQPALKELVLKAPGTYHHSLVVGNLAESAAEAVNANSLLARVGAYYHDIGKIRMAHYFSENQTHQENKHDSLTPTISSLLIINHVKEGKELAQEYRLGPVIQDIISQHHGNDLVHYFYHRALAKDSEGRVQADDFRYPGPKPQFKEAAIVMLADSVEAASRSLPQPTPAKIKELVNRIINNKFIDGQLDECDLTLKNLHLIAETFARILNGIYHSRVSYPPTTDNNAEQNSHSQSSEHSLDKSTGTAHSGQMDS